MLAGVSQPHEGGDVQPDGPGNGALNDAGDEAGEWAEKGIGDMA